MDWQPIETAPKDAERLLLYSDKEASDCTPQIGTWDATAKCWVTCWDGTPLDRQASKDLWEAPTHWMPLPDPPATANEDDEIAYDLDHDRSTR